MKYLLALLAAVGLYAQNPAQIQPSTTNPNGLACTSRQLRLYVPTGVIFTCVNGLFASGAGGGTGTFTVAAPTVVGNLIAATNTLGTGGGDSGIPIVSGVSAGTYGDSTHVGQFTVGSFGAITSAVSVGISGTGGVGTPPTSGSFTGTTQTITAATHGQGTKPIVTVVDNATPRNFVQFVGTIAVNGDVVIGPLVNGTYNYWIEGATGGFANCMTTAGDIIYGGASGICTRLGIGAAGTVLVGGSAPAWSTLAAAGIVVGAANLTNPCAIPFQSGTTGTLTQDATAFCWDATNHRLGIGNSLPQVLGDFHLGTGSQTNQIRIYNSFTDASNGSWLQLESNSNGNVYIGGNKNGSGTSPGLTFLVGGSSTLSLGASALFPSTSGNLDLGVETNRFRTAFIREDFITGTVPGISGCSAGTQLGGGSAGSFVSGTTGICTVTLTFVKTATNAWFCDAQDITTFSGATNLIAQTGGSTTTAVLAGTTVSGDLIRFKCLAY